VPDFAPEVDRHLPGARASVLARLWGALAREPIPGLASRHTDGDDLVVKLPDGRRLRGPAASARPFAPAPENLRLGIDGTRYADPATLLRALGLPTPTAHLEAELDNSVENLALARTAQPRPDGGQPAVRRAVAEPDPLAYFEQCVVDGHPLHPCCRTRVGLSRAEVLAYAPEHHGIVELVVVSVPPSRWVGTNSPPVLVVHPWQYEHVLDHHPWLQPQAERHPARPLMSLRTLASVRNPRDHVKTAIDVQMTSAVRTVSAAALHNGPVLTDVLGRLLARTQEIVIVPEVSTGAVLVDGEPCRSLAMIRRRLPRLASDEVAMPLAALAAPSPADGRPLAVEIVRYGYAHDPLRLLDDLTRLLLPPLLALLHQGVALEAHGQNTLLVLKHGRAVRLLYRDMGGLRVSPARLHRHGIDPPPLRGDVVSDNPEVLRTKLFAAALSTVVGELVAVVAREFALSDEALWACVATAARDARDALPAAGRADAAAMFAESLPVKAMTAMRLATDPVEDLWTRQPNPMAGLA
jgi:siderophore synthetase component